MGKISGWLARRTKPEFSELSERLRSYLYVRCAVLALTLFLLVSLVVQIGSARWHLLPSISAYWYTPVRTPFTGGLIGIGACLIALYGHTWFEEVLWSIAGMCAPLVALVPTTPPKSDTWPNDVNPTVNNNLVTFAIILVVLLIVNIILVVKPGKKKRRHKLLLVSTCVYFVLAAAYLLWLRQKRSEHEAIGHEAHDITAIAMFGILAISFLLRSIRETAFRRIMLVCSVLMLGVGIGFAVFKPFAPNHTFWLELIEISLFSVLWAADTVRAARLDTKQKAKIDQALNEVPPEQKATINAALVDE